MSSLSRKDGSVGGSGVSFDGFRRNMPRNVQMQPNHYQTELNHQLPSQQQPSPQVPPTHAHLMHWPNHALGATSYIHAQPHQHLYNIHSAASPTAPVGVTRGSGGGAQQESYSMLRMGNGNFLKIYHYTDNSIMGNVTPSDAPFTALTQSFYNHQTQPNQQHLQTAYHHHHHHHHHMPQQQNTITSQSSSTKGAQILPNQTQQQPASAPPPQIFNSYELFSSNTFSQLRSTEIAPVLLVGPKNKTNNNDNNEIVNINNNNNNNNSNHNQIMEDDMPNDNRGIINDNTTSDIDNANMIINNLMNNWTQNVNGGGMYSQFAVQSYKDPLQNVQVTSIASETTTMTPTVTTESEPIPASNNDTVPTASEQQIDKITVGKASPQIEDAILPVTIQEEEASPRNSSHIEHKADVKQEVKSTATIPLKDHTLDITSSSRQDTIMAPKKRIVAEVKPMRMTYSDVLSKFNNTNNSKMQLQQHEQHNVTSLKTSSTVGTAVATPIMHRPNTKMIKLEIGATPITPTATLTTNNHKNRNRSNDDNHLNAMKQIKRSPSHNNNSKENVLNSSTQETQQQQQILNVKSTNNNGKQRANITSNGPVYVGPSPKSSLQSQKQQNHSKNSGITVTNGIGVTSSSVDIRTKKRSNATKKASIKDYDIKDGQRQQHQQRSNGSGVSSYVSNVSSGFINGGRKGIKTVNNQTPNSTGMQSQEQQQQQGHRLHRYQNNGTISNASYSYSTAKRSRHNNTNNFSTNIGNNNNNNSNNSNQYIGSNSSYTTTSGGNGGHYHHHHQNNESKNKHYELAKLFLMVWLRYTMKILTWLFYLVYDIIVLGCSMLYDHVELTCESLSIYIQHMYNDLKQNSYKPNVWFKNYWKRFDTYFMRNSKWAFWRRYYKKKTTESSTQETVKIGRLPQTGEEAMYTLLNCKGKDAYSILGVPSNSSTEQIRKHYKKIAVLVHPDKNKQPGAEEAFKVLQRAFELIGEPENRLAYDQSIAEALHAEKAWTELHDLLSQLQTKITEAANTIRCSSCGLRHPRKLTDRPHYAARECATCKIRHSAREGDIWAETSLMGLRWKYLALMEGKVYDITEWANCQRGALTNLEPNSHMVQYRIVRGAQQQHQQNKQQQQQHQKHHHNGKSSPSNQQGYCRSNSGDAGIGSGGIRTTTNRNNKFKCDNIPSSESSIHEFLDNLYSGQHPRNQQHNTATGRTASNRRRNRRN